MHDRTDSRDSKIYAGTPESPPKLIGSSCEEISERAKEIQTVQAVRYIASQSDAIYSSADLPKVFALRAGIRIVRLIVIFATFAISSIRPSEGEESSDVNLRAEKLICAQDGMARADLKA